MNNNFVWVVLYVILTVMCIQHESVFFNWVGGIVGFLMVIGCVYDWKNDNFKIFQ